MKKFLLGTTALISLSAASAAMAGGSHAPAAAAPANTGGLTVMVGGSLDFQSAFINQDENSDLGNEDTSDQVFTNDTHINVTAAGSTEDFDYGAVVSIFADTGPDKDYRTSTYNTDDGNGDGDKSYIYVENDSFGRVEGGANVGADSAMEVDASRVARATGGVDGDARYYVTQAGSFITTPNLTLGDDYTNAGVANKLTYYTPRFSGFQLGVSYAPDSGNIGTVANLSADDDSSDFENVFQGGISFEGDVSDGVTLMASVVGETGNSQDDSGTLTNDLSEYSLGLGLEFEGFSIAGNWADLGDSGLAADGSDGDEQTYWTIGAGYENGPYGVSVTYLDSEQSDSATTSNELTNLVVGADYQMAPGLTPYIEAAFFDLSDSDPTEDNSGNVVLVGANLAF